MNRFVAALALSFSLIGGATAQSLTEVPIANVPALVAQLKNPTALYASGAALNVQAAYYENLTDRYGHNIFAAPSEYTTLVVKVDGVEHRLTLSSDVFEDTYPLIFDLDGDGNGEIITTQSSLSGGASIAIYGVQGSNLEKISQTPNIGTRNRWMNIAGIADFNGDGNIEIALVDRPHIRGELEFWTFTKERKLELRLSSLGFSNHFIGSSAQRLSAVIQAESAALLLLPSTDRRTLTLVDASTNKIRIVASAALPAQIVDNFAHVIDGTSSYIGLALADGSQKAFKISR